MKRCVWLTLIVVLTRAAASGEGWTTDEEAKTIYEHLHAFFDGAEIRYPGSAANLKIEQKVADEFAASGFKQGEIRFSAPVLRPGKTTLTLKGQTGPAIPLLPMHPTLIRPGNFKTKQVEANLVYMGRGTVEDLVALKGVDLEGAIALMEFDCAANWLRLLRFGVKGFIFIGQDRYDFTEAQAKIYGSEVAVPRFFVPASQGAQLRQAVKDAGKSPPVVNIQAEPTRWESVWLRNLWVLIPGSNPDFSKEVCVVVAPLDSNCVVPELAEGAQNAANLHLLMHLLQAFQQQPPARPLLLVAVNAHTQYFLGERMLAWHLLAPPPDVEAVRTLMAEDINLQRFYAKAYGELDALLNNEATAQDAEKLLIDMREKVDSEAMGRGILVKKPLVALVKGDVSRTKTQGVAAFRKARQEGVGEEEARKLNAEIAAQREKYVKVLQLFNRWGQTTRLSDLNAEEKEILCKYVKQVLDKNKRFADLNQRDLDINQANNKIRDALEGRGVRWVLNLDLTWRGPKVGLASGEFWTNPEWRRAWGAKTVEVANELPEVKAGKENLFVDSMTFKGGLPEGFYFSYPGVLGFFHGASKTPAFSLQNPFTNEGRAFTPADTLESLDRRTLADLTVYVPQWLRGV